MDINSSIQKLDPMHVEVSTFITRDEGCDEGIKQEYLTDHDNHIYVSGGGHGGPQYHGTAVFELPQGSDQHCQADPHGQYTTYTISCSGQLANESGHGHDTGYSEAPGQPPAPVGYSPAPPPPSQHCDPIHRHTPPPPYNNSYSSNPSFSPCSSSSSSLSPPINVSTR